MSEAVCFLASSSARNAKALSEWIGYLQKHAEEIIDDACRAAISKPIGKGRMEKAIDPIIRSPRMKKGMRWSEHGNHVLALLKIAQT